jgi:hypothetical protein
VAELRRRAARRAQRAAPTLARPRLPPRVLVRRPL